jgi:hypothetical protein
MKLTSFLLLPIILIPNPSMFPCASRRSKGVAYAMMDGITNGLIGALKSLAGQKTISEANIGAYRSLCLPFVAFSWQALHPVPRGTLAIAATTSSDVPPPLCCVPCADMSAQCHTCHESLAALILWICIIAFTTLHAGP